MKRAPFLALPLLAACGAEPVPPPTNVLLVVVDTLRADHTSAYGYERETTPFLEELVARDDVFVFANAKSPAPWTKPSVTSVMTGLLPSGHQADKHTEPMHGDFFTLGEAFAALDFDTAGVQSNKLVADFQGYDQGFARWNQDHLSRHDESVGVGINAVTRSYLEELGDAPFFLYVHHYEPHFQYMESGERWYSGYNGPLTGNESMDQLVGATNVLREEERLFLESRYDADILYQDVLLRELFADLERTGHADDTLVVITSDHGEEFLEHGDVSHQYKLYEELLHVPLIVVDPRGADSPLAAFEADELARPVSTIDVGATLFDLLDKPTTFPGYSLLDPDRFDPDAVVAEVLVLGFDPEEDFPWRDSITADGFKLIRTTVPGAEPTFELYDLGSDPGEQRDLADARPERVSELARRLDAKLADRARFVPPGERYVGELELSAEQRQALEHLGYL